MRRLIAAMGLLCVFGIALFAFLHFCTGKESNLQQDQIYWSGYTWQVRPSGVGLPGPNRWSNTDDNVKVNDDGSLTLAITKKDGVWHSGQIENTKSLGYGTYRWEIASDLSKMDPRSVLGLFTYNEQDVATHTEIDIEATRWGNAQSDNGQVSYWIPGNKQIKKGFNFTDQPPYQVQFQWRPGKLSFYASDRTGKPLIDVLYDELIPQPGQEVATVNFWRFKNIAPMHNQSVTVTKFTWEPLAKGQ